jgi:hypothetical protein
VIDMKRFIFAVIGLGVAGCNTTQNQAYTWARADGKAVSPAQFELDKTICLGETQKSAVGMAPIYYHGIGGAVGAAIIENQRGDALKDVAKGCMAQHGYLQVAVAPPAYTGGARGYTASYAGGGTRYNTPLGN